MLNNVESSLKMTVVLNINVKVNVVVEVEAKFHQCLHCLHDVGCRQCALVVEERICELFLIFFSKISVPLSG